MPSHRGRRSREDQIERAMHLFRQELVALEDAEEFAECRGVQALVPLLPRETLKCGSALALLIQGAAGDVLGELCSAETRQTQRLAQFLHYWFREHMSVAEIASLLHLDRTTVGRAIKGPALTLVAQRFLYLSRQDEPLSESPGLQEALRQHEHRRAQAIERVVTMRPITDRMAIPTPAPPQAARTLIANTGHDQPEEADSR